MFDIALPCRMILDLDMNVQVYSDAHNQAPPKIGVPYFTYFGLQSTFPGCTFWQTKSDGISTSFSLFLPFHEHKIRVQYTPMLDAHGEIISILQDIRFDNESLNTPETVSRDINQEFISEHFLRKKLRTTISRQQNLLRLVGHQLQRPLALIQGYTDLFFDSPEEAYKNIVTKEINHASFLIQQLLKYGQIETGNKTLSLKRRSLEPFLKELFSGIFSPSEHSYTLDFPPHDMIVCRFDAFELGESIKTILENAIKYVPSASPIVCHVQSEDQYVQIIISDTGPGIPQDVLAFLWEPFGRGEHHVSTEGFGLGLPLAKKIIELHGGKISCSSDVGIGTRFTISLPRIAPAE